MKAFLILRLVNAAYVCDARGDHNIAALIHEAIKEIEHGNIRAEIADAAQGKGLDGERDGGSRTR